MIGKARAGALYRCPWLHPCLFALYPVLHLYVQNIGGLAVETIAAPASISLLGAAILLLATNAILRDWDKSAFLTSLFVILFFTVNHVLWLVNHVPFLEFHLTQGRYQILLFMAVFGFGVAVLCSLRRHLGNVTRTMNIIGILLIAVNTLRAAAFTSAGGAIVSPDQSEKVIASSPSTATHDRPDIYYIILDGYGSSKTLKRLFGYDNQQFENYLKSRGFYVASASHSNYHNTMLSMAATFNMDYIGPSKKSYEKSVTENRVWQVAESHGYRVIQLSSWSPRKYVMSSMNGEGLSSEFNLTLLRSSVLDRVAGRIGVYDASVRRGILEILGKFEPVSAEKGPKFVYAHIMCPHPPYVFGPNGEPIKPSISGNLNIFRSPWDQRNEYLGQVLYINNRIIEVVERLLREYGPKRPVIIIQGDHGPKFVREGDDGNEYYETRLGILNAYLLPNGGEKRLYQDITPVNSFRVIFDEYFGESYPTLEDKSYFTSNDAMPFNFREVTKQLSRPG